jgi:3-phenylpropionate/cinnamic acid dioxygenase small subunit
MVNGKSWIDLYCLEAVTMSTPTPIRGPDNPPSSGRAIENLIATYAELVDDGDFAGVGALLADATFTGDAGSVNGRDAIEKMLRDGLIVYDDGTPRTKHVTTNVAIEVDEEAGTAVSRSYFTALQALPDLALQPIVSGRYHDRFERRDRQWRFAERRVQTDLVGDVSRHLRRGP